MTPDPPSSPVETTGAVPGTTSYTGVIRGADEARVTKWADLILIATGCGAISEVNTRSLMGIADGENAALTAEVKHAWRHVDEAVGERDAARAMIATDDTELQAKDATIAERDASIARLTTRHAKDEPCPDSCGGQSWTGVNTNYGRRWRCDTCGRVISRYISDAIQAADDRRSL